MIIILVLAYPFGRIFAGSLIGDRLIWVGSFWMGAMFYGLLIGLLFDLIRLGDIPFGWIPDILLKNVYITRRILLVFSVAFVISILWYGHYLSLKLVTKNVIVSLSKNLKVDRDYHVAAFADSHLGALIGRARLEQIVERVNDIDPDICLIIGDLVDEPAERLAWAIEPLSRIKSRDGVYVVLGNHEYYAGIKEFSKFVNKAGIILIRDSSYTIENQLNIIGLDDSSARKQFQQKPVSIQSIVGNIDSSLPTVLMHHTPTRMFEAQAQGVDLMISGHTHGGQIWPFSFLTRLTYGVRQGMTNFGSMKFFLTNGVGTWGPPLRIGSTPEVVHFTLKSE